MRTANITTGLAITKFAAYAQIKAANAT